MSIFYLLGIKIFQAIIIFSSFFNAKAKLWINGRKNIFNKLKSTINKTDNIIWFHCPSLGEFEQGRPVIEEVKAKYPQYKILLTFYSPSGFEIRKNYEKADYVFYMPVDTPKNAKTFLKIVNPKMVFFVKYDFWYFFLKQINKKQIPLYLISGIFRKNQRFFKPWGAFSRKMLSFFTHFFVQNTESKELLNSVKLQNITISGDTRFDRVYDIAQRSQKLSLAEKFAENSIVLIAGSSWRADEEILSRYYNELKNHNIKMIIAPHETHKENIKHIQKLFSTNIQTLKYSEANEQNVQKAHILIIDSIGILSSLYKYGNIAYIGGGFGKGIHNTLEAATFGLPVLFGPNYTKFKEAKDLINIGGAFPVHHYKDLKQNLDSLFNNLTSIKAKGEIAFNYVKNNKGATGLIINEIKRKL